MWRKSRAASGERDPARWSRSSGWLPTAGCTTAPGRIPSERLVREPPENTFPLNDAVLPTYEKHGATINAVISDNGREFRGRPDR